MVFLSSFSLFVIYCNLYSVTMWICALLRVGRREKNVQGSRFVMYRSCPGKTLEAFKSSSRVRRKKERKGKRLRPRSSVLLVLRAVLHPAENVAFSYPTVCG